MPRSGTTLLVELLASSQLVVAAPETHAFGRIPSALWERPWAQQEYVRILRRLADYPGCQVDEGLLESLVPEPPPADPVEFVFRVVGAHGREAEVLIEKTPRHIEFAGRALAVDRDLTVIVIVRDARDVHRSLRETSWDPGDLFENAQRWNRYSDLAIDLRREHPGRVRCIRFEDLVRDCDSILGEIGSSLGIQVAPQRGAVRRRPVSFAPDGEPWKRRASEVVDPHSAERWRSAPSADDERISALCRERLEVWGYENL